jgi:hypothetical protein
LHGVKEIGRGNGDRYEPGSALGETIDRCVGRGFDVIGDSVEEAVARHADPESVEIVAYRCAVVVDCRVVARGIVGVPAGDGVEEDRCVLDGPRDRTHMIE